MSNHDHINGHNDSGNHGQTLECLASGCAGHDVTADATAVLREWEETPSAPIEEWKAGIEASGKGHFLPKPDRGVAPR